MTPEQLNTKLAAIPNTELAARARKWITDLCNSGGQKWTLRVPPDPSHDPDLIFGELCRRVEAMEPTSVPTCSCGHKMELVEFDGYYDRFEFFECQNPGCLAIDCGTVSVTKYGAYNQP